MDVRLTTSLEVSYRVTLEKNDTAKKETTQPDQQTDTKTDSYQHTTSEKKVTYDQPGVKPDWKTIQKLIDESDRANSKLEQIVTELLRRQGLKFKDIYDIQAQQLQGVEIDETAQKEAQAMLEEGGELSAAKVSDRIVEFAKAISGGDKSKLDQLKKAIDDGFAAAQGVLGRVLPEISKQTYEMVMTKLDDWAKEDGTSDKQETPDENHGQNEAVAGSD